MMRLVTFRFSKEVNSSLRLPSFGHFPLHSSVFKYLQANEIHTPTYIQYSALSAISSTKHKKYHLTAPTGTGKTLSYLLPIASALKLQEDKRGALTASQRPRALVITGTKQLVLQCRDVGKQISHHCKLKMEGLNIGRSLKEERQTVKQGVDILISTHKRLLPLLENKTLLLSKLQWLVVDEADTLFQTGRLQPLLDNLLPCRQMSEGLGQLVLTSTTRPLQMRDYLKSTLGEYRELVDKRSHINLQNIKHQFVQCSSLDKHQTLLSVLSTHKDSHVIIFCNTVDSLHQLQHFLQERGEYVTTLHSQLHKQARLQNYRLFSGGQSQILLSTDLGARGLDFQNLNLVVNYDFPRSSIDYLQRAGRTGRAGKKGQVVTLYHKKNLPVINELRGAGFKHPLKVGNTAYSLRNRELARK